MKRTILTEVLIALIVGGCLPPLTGCGIEGINNANPRTKMRANPQTGYFEFYDSKDNDLEITGLGVDGKGHVDKVIIRNNASDVRRANGDSQMPGMALQGSVAWQGAQNVIDSTFNGFAKIMPGLSQLQATRLLGQMPRSQSVQTPWGALQTGAGFTDAQVQALLQLAGTALPGKTEPESKPSQ